MKFTQVCFLAAMMSTASAFAPPSSSTRFASVQQQPQILKAEPVNGATAVDTPIPEAASAPVAVLEPPAPAAEESTQEEEQQQEAEEPAPQAVAAAPVAAVEPVVESPVVEEEKPAAPVDPRTQLQPGRYDGVDYSMTLPFLPRPTKLDGSHAGDFGFDPLGFTEEYDLYYMQECELRHARLAMLAVVGWPLAELVGPNFLLTDTGCAPSVLNGMGILPAISILAVFGGLGFLEFTTSLRQTSETALGKKHKADMAQIWKWGIAGDYNFDPLNLYSSLGDDAHGRRALRELEVTQGRYAMLGITYFCLYEAAFKTPIVQDNVFFHPNPWLPAAALAYGIWSQFYQISDVRKYPIKVEYTNDGEEKLRSIQRSMDGVSSDFKAASDAVQGAVDTVQGGVNKVTSMIDNVVGEK